jgi:hypothetical protein
LAAQGKSLFGLRDVGNATATGRKAMHIAISNAPALLLWHDFRWLPGDLTGNGFVWLLIGILLVFVVISALAIEAALVLEAPHRPPSRPSWPADVSESTAPLSPGPASLDDLGTPS